jgi:hypothetical protein
VVGCLQCLAVPASLCAIFQHVKNAHCHCHLKPPSLLSLAGVSRETSGQSHSTKTKHSSISRGVSSDASQRRASLSTEVVVVVEEELDSEAASREVSMLAAIAVHVTHTTSSV